MKYDYTTDSSPLLHKFKKLERLSSRFDGKDNTSVLDILSLGQQKNISTWKHKMSTQLRFQLSF